MVENNSGTNKAFADNIGTPAATNEETPRA